MRWPKGLGFVGKKHSFFSHALINAEVDFVQLTKDFTNAQILSLATTRLELLAPTEILEYEGLPTSLPIVVSAFIQIKKVVDYSNIDAAFYILLAYGSDWSADASVKALSAGSAFVTAGVSGIWLPSLMNSPTVIDPSGYPYITQALQGNLQDNGLYLAMSNGALGNLEGGDEDNIMRVTVAYHVAQILT